MRAQSTFRAYPYSIAESAPVLSMKWITRRPRRRSTLEKYAHSAAAISACIMSVFLWCENSSSSLVVRARSRCSMAGGISRV